MPVDVDLDRPLVLLSHRGPVGFRRVRGERRVDRGAGGLVTALSGLAEHLQDAVWVCAADSAEDRKVAEEHGDRAVEVAFTPQPHLVEPGAAEAGPGIRTRMVAVSKRAHELFYGVIANPLLWFVQHGLYGQGMEPVLTKADRVAFEKGYVAVDNAFADAVIAQARSLDPDGRVIVLLQDYHFYLVGARVREACPQALISHFVHIPWPGPDGWRILPPDMRTRLLTGLLGCDIVGFHTSRDARNFLACCAEFLDVEVDHAGMTVRVDGRTVRAANYPISIDVAATEELARSERVAEVKERMTGTYLGGDRQLVLRVDRTDPSKNIVRGFQAFDVLLGDHPELKGRATFYAMLQPSRQDVSEYADYLTAIGGLVAEVNARHGGDGWQPIILRLEEDLSRAVAAYSICDALCVNAVNDGMNLVAKEMAVVNERDAVLLLSENTGAHEELGEYALTVHPFDVQQQADAMYRALSMPRAERRRRLAAAAQVVRDNDVARWLRTQLADLRALEPDGD